MTKIRKIVSLDDPTYFCNKSWTLSYSFITNSWISFHSYTPNFYIGENNFFYSGIKTCCDPDIEFNFIAGQLVPNSSTTTSTSSSTSSTSSTTTTSTTLDCTLIGIVELKACDLAGIGIITVPPVPPACLRPLGVVDDIFIRGYIKTGNVEVITTGSSIDACNGINYMATNSDWALLSSEIQFLSLSIGNSVYLGANVTDCTTVPDGWYFTQLSSYSGDIYHVVSGVIVSTFNCNPSTTTTSTTPAAVQTFKVSVEGESDMVIHSVIPSFFTLNPGNAFPVTAGNTITGVVNSAGVTVTINYSCTSKIPQIMFIRNNIVMGNDVGIPVGNNQNYAYNIPWTAGDIIEIRLL